MTDKTEFPCSLQHLGGGSFSQVRISFANLTVVRRQPQAGGGILLTVTTDGRSIEFVLDEPARQALVEQLAGALDD